MRDSSIAISFWLVLAALFAEECDAFIVTNSRPADLARLRTSNNSNINKNTDEDSTVSNTTPSPPDTTAEPVRTIGGGAETIFEMARKMLLWDETEGSVLQNQPAATTTTTSTTVSSVTSTGGVLPRWRPMRGVSDTNPAFRTSAPVMNSQGYASTIWRNVRKANKPSLWRHALRTYDRMVENPATEMAQMTNPDGTLSKKNKFVKVQRNNIHYEGALVACAKLGLWQKALYIYNEVEEKQRANNMPKVFVTDNMVLSLIRSCVLASRVTDGGTRTVEERRASLDACLTVLLDMESKHKLPLVARHLNPLAAAYQHIGLLQESRQLLLTHLSDRTSGPEEENGDDPFNVNDVRAKDKGSYSLLVKGAVSEGNWEDAVEALKTMTEAGVYPNDRNLNSWTEVSERKTKQRATRSWKKKRDEYWMESVR